MEPLHDTAAVQHMLDTITDTLIHHIGQSGCSVQQQSRRQAQLLLLLSHIRHMRWNWIMKYLICFYHGNSLSFSTYSAENRVSVIQSVFCCRSLAGEFFKSVRDISWHIEGGQLLFSSPDLSITMDVWTHSLIKYSLRSMQVLPKGLCREFYNSRLISHLRFIAIVHAMQKLWQTMLRYFLWHLWQTKLWTLFMTF